MRPQVRSLPSPHLTSTVLTCSLGLPGNSDGKEFACSAEDPSLTPRLGRSPGEGHGNPLQYSCLDNPYGQRSLAGYSPWGHEESDMTERLTHTAIQQACAQNWGRKSVKG